MNTITLLKSRLDVFAAELYYLRRSAEIRLEAKREPLYKAARLMDHHGAPGRFAWLRYCLRCLRGYGRGPGREQGSGGDIARQVSPSWFLSALARLVSVPGSPLWFMAPRMLDGSRTPVADSLRWNQAVGGTFYVMMIGMGLWVYLLRSVLRPASGPRRIRERWRYRGLALRMAAVLLYEEARLVRRAERYRARTEYHF